MSYSHENASSNLECHTPPIFVTVSKFHLYSTDFKGDHQLSWKSLLTPTCTFIQLVLQRIMVGNYLNLKVRTEGRSWGH